MRRRWILAVALLALALPQLVHAEMRTWFGFQVGIRGGDVPPPPFVLRSAPRLVVVDDVYMVDGPLNILDLGMICDLKRPDLKYRPLRTHFPKPLSRRRSVFDAIRHRDELAVGIEVSTIAMHNRLDDEIDQLPRQGVLLGGDGDSEAEWKRVLEESSKF